MGTFATWGAIGGAAKGAEKGILLKQEEEAANKKATVDYARQVALQRLKGSQDMDVEEARQTGAFERLEAGGENTIEAIRERGKIQGALQDDEQASDMELKKIDQTTALAAGSMTNRTRLAVEKMGIEAGKYEKAGAGGSSDPRYKALYDRFESKTLTVQEANEVAPEFPIESDSPAVYDSHAGRWYIQKGNDMIVAGDSQMTYAQPKDKIGAENKLFEDPSLYPNFLREYGYLPADFLPVVRAFDLAQAGYGSFGEPKTQE